MEEITMSSTIDTTYVNQYSANIQILMQQKGSKLQDAVRVEMQDGEYAYYDQLSKQTAIVTGRTRASTTTLADSPFVRRRVGLEVYSYSEIIDETDVVKMMGDPTWTIAQNVAYLFGRTKDAVILTAVSGVAYTGKTGSTSTSFDNDMIITASGHAYSGSTSTMNVDKLLGAKYLLDAEDVDDDGRYVIAHPKVRMDLLQLEKVTSGDYVFKKALGPGDFDEYLGFKFIWTTQTPTTVSYAWHKSAVLLAIGMDDKGFKATLTRNPERWNQPQLFNEMMIGATRMDETAVVQIITT